MSTVTGLFSLEEAGQELGLSPLGVKRLVARGKMTAHRLGDRGPVRIAGEEIKRYVVGGARDLNGPALHNGYIDSRREAGDAAAFRARVVKQLAKELPDDPPNRDRVDVKASNAVRSLIRQPPGKLVRVAGDDAGPELDARMIYTVSELRRMAQPIADRYSRENRIAGGAINAIYDGPAAYAEITGEAGKAFLASGMTTRHTYPHTGPGYGNGRVVAFTLRHTELADTMTPARLIAAAIEVAF